MPTHQWKIVEKRRQRKAKEKTGDQTEKILTASRFNVLADVVGDNVINHEDQVVMVDNPSWRLKRREKMDRLRTLQGDFDGRKKVGVGGDATNSDMRQLVLGQGALPDNVVQERGATRRAEKRLRDDFKGATSKESNLLMLTMGETSGDQDKDGMVVEHAREENVHEKPISYRKGLWT